VLSDISVPQDDRVLVDFRTADDGGVYALDADTALVQTVDFFTPVVDDPYDFGAIAAANALSDVYAMGGVPISALAIAAFPKKGFPADDIRAVFRGGFDVLREAGVVLLGGHTVQDTEVKFGYAVTGTVVPGRHWANAGARPGDALLLTKPLGTGIVATAIKYAAAPEATTRAAVAVMRQLNAAAARVLREAPEGVVHACTDITGFGFLGHACEMAEASGVRLRIDASLVPEVEGARELAPQYQAGGAATTEAHFGGKVRLGPAVDSVTRALLYDPQTSGGLFVAVEASEAGGLLAALRQAGVEAVVVGEVTGRGPADDFLIDVR
jgi:selenide,water dikinase